MFHLPSCLRTTSFTGLAILAVSLGAARAQTQTNQANVTTQTAAAEAATSPQPAAETAAQAPSINVPMPAQAQPATKLRSRPHLSPATKTYEVPAGTKSFLNSAAPSTPKAPSPATASILLPHFPW